MSGPLTRHFLIVFDTESGMMREEVRDFDDGEDAVVAYREAEQRYETDRHIEVVLIASDSLATVKITHPNYWGSVDLLKLALGR